MRVHQGVPIHRRPVNAVRTRRVVTNQRCVLCGQFHTHRMQVPTYVRPPAVLYAVCPDTLKIITVRIPETAL